MKEEFLHYVWKHKLLSTVQLQTTQNETVRIQSWGQFNVNTGPDFLFAKIYIDDKLWIGHVEIHLKSSDWYWHGHENDANYDPVILHVVWDHDVEVFSRDNKPLPVLELKQYVKDSIIKNYHSVIQQDSWIPCEKHLKEVDTFVLDHWLERLFFERLERKSKFIESLLLQSNYDFEYVLFLSLMQSFGLRLNSEAFLDLARSFPFKIVKKIGLDVLHLEALLFGQAGFLEEVDEDSYYQALQKEYKFLQHKYNLSPLESNRFQFFRMRPHNFPTIRLAQFASFYASKSNLFSDFIALNSLEESYTFFNQGVSEFWKNHYTFSKQSKPSTKRLTKPFIQLLIINTFVPLKFLYSRYMGQDYEDAILRMVDQIPAEKNSILNQFNSLGLTVNNAKESQSLLELKNNYCAKKRCLQCAIGNQLLKMS